MFIVGCLFELNFFSCSWFGWSLFNEPATKPRSLSDRATTDDIDRRNFKRGFASRSVLPFLWLFSTPQNIIQSATRANRSIAALKFCKPRKVSSRVGNEYFVVVWRLVTESKTHKRGRFETTAKCIAGLPRQTTDLSTAFEHEWFCKLVNIVF